MVIKGIGLWMSSMFVIGFLQENGNGTFYPDLDTNNISMNWYEAQNYCRILNSSLVDPFEHEISVNGSFWTNRHLATYSSWIYIEGCVNISSMNISGRIVSSVWQCDNLCNHTKFFGIQNSTCVCLASSEFDVRKMCDADCLKYNSPLNQCRKSDFMTLYGKFTESIEWKPTDGNCLTLKCENRKKFVPHSCSTNLQCVCSNGESSTFKNEISGRSWTACFDICGEDKFIWTTTTCSGKNSQSTPFWIAVKRQINGNKEMNDSEPYHCYRCAFNTSECWFDSCSQKYLPRCEKDSNMKEETTNTLLPTQHGHDNVKSTDREKSSKGTVLIMTTKSSLAATTSINDVSNRMENYNIGPENEPVQIIIAVTVSGITIIVICAAALFVYRYRRKKAISNDGNVRVLFQNEYTTTNKPTIGNGESCAGSREEDEELPYVDSSVDVYDHLGEKHKRKFSRESDNVYSRPSPLDTQYGDVCLTPLDDTYDHTKAYKMNDSDYDSCTR